MSKSKAAKNIREYSSSELSGLSARFKDYFLTKSSSILGVYELAGVDPTGLGKDDRVLNTALLRSILQNSPPDMTLTQYYIHQAENKVAIKDRADPKLNLITQRRTEFLNSERELNSARIFFIPELPFARDLTSFSNFEFLQNLISYPLSKQARSYIKNRLSEKQSYLAYKEDLLNAASQLEEEIDLHVSRLSFSSKGKKLSAGQAWSLFNALYNFYFDGLNNKSSVAKNNLDSRVFDSTIEQVCIDNVDYIKLTGVQTVYVRFASIKGFTDEHIKESLYSTGLRPPTMVKGNYIIMNRYKGFNASTQKKKFNAMRDDVERSNVNFTSLMSSNQRSDMEKQLALSDKDKRTLEEISIAESTQDFFGDFESCVAIFSSDPKKITQTAKELRASFNQTGIEIVWEVAGLMSALETFLPASKLNSKRSFLTNTSKAAALSLFYRSHSGLKKWKTSTKDGMKDEEYFYVFESNDGTPFYYTPFVGGRCLVIGIGPTRSGKTFTKNTLATHFMKFRGYYNAIDIDTGTEPLAKYFEEEGSVFRLDREITAGFNPFLLASGVNDRSFRSHFYRQLELMIKSNSSAEMREFKRDEQEQIESAILSTLALPKEMRSFKTFLDHCNKDIKAKLSRFYGDGVYARIYDNQEDAIGSNTQRFNVFNIMGVKDDEVSLPLVMSEITYRVIRVFENPQEKDKLKMLDIDEAHAFLDIPKMPEFLAKGSVTWGKWNGCVSLWTQTPEHLKKTKNWSAIKGAATAFWFMADPKMDRACYKEIFDLSDGILDAIESLIPKQQAFIYQPELGIAKVVNLFAEPEQRVINASVAGEAMVRDRNFEKYDNINEAIEQTIKELNF